jgi:hypothetical protein
MEQHRSASKEIPMISNTSLQAFTSISRVRRRNDVLKSILPKIFGIISEKGQSLEGFPGCAARLDGELTLTGSHFGPDLIMLSVYWPVKSSITKVFSAHVTDLPSSGDPNFYRFCNGCVGLLSWRRGEWEDAVMGHPASPLSLSETFLRGVFRTENQLLH